MERQAGPEATGLPRRRFIGGAAAATALGAAASVTVGSPAGADGGGGGGGRTFSRRGMPKPIAFSTPPDPAVPAPFDSLHWTLPGPEGLATQKIGIPAFGPDTDPNTIGDFEGFTAYAVVAGEATSADGEPFDCEFDLRVMQGRYVAEDGKRYDSTFAFLWLDLLLPGQGGPGQVHDFNPGIAPNGLFWTMELPAHSFRVGRRGRWARLRLRNAPVPDTFFFSNNVSVAAEIDVDLTWRSTSAPIRRGNGTTVPSDAPDAYLGDLRDATCRGRAAGRETGFTMKTGRLTEDGFLAWMGHTRNGVFLA